MKILFTRNGLIDYQSWSSDRAKLDRINRLIADIQEGDPFVGIGKPEPLRFALSGSWSRRIDTEHRLVYRIQDNTLVIIATRGHCGR